MGQREGLPCQLRDRAAQQHMTITGLLPINLTGNELRQQPQWKYMVGQHDQWPRWRRQHERLGRVTIRTSSTISGTVCSRTVRHIAPLRNESEGFKHRADQREF